jgi:hypothetical protein
MTMRRLLLLALGTALAAGCKSNGDQDTQIVVAVWSDLSVPAEMSGVRIEVAGSVTRSRSFTLTGDSKLPVLLELLPLGIGGHYGVTDENYVRCVR